MEFTNEYGRAIIDLLDKAIEGVSVRDEVKKLMEDLEPIQRQTLWVWLHDLGDILVEVIETKDRT